MSSAVATYHVNLGLMFPHDTGERLTLMPKMGYSTSAGAVGLALDRIQKERLLPGANITWDMVDFVVRVQWRMDQCDESLAAGFAVQLFRTRAVDVMFGPTCSTPAAVVGVLASYYGVAQFSWAATGLDLADHDRYPTMTRVIGSAIRLGRAMSEILLYLDWTRVALFYTDDRATRKCLSVAQGAYKFFPTAGIHIVLFQEIDGEVPTDGEIDKFLTHFPHLTRIALLCIDQDADIRRFMLRAQERGLSGEEYVYVVPDYVRSENKTDVWTDRDATRGGSSERNVESRESMQNILFIEMLLTDNDKLFQFKKEVAGRIAKWPFFYESERLDETYGSLYSPFLHDSVYLYALALNKTLEAGGNKSDGRLITENTKNTHFLGVSGHVVIDDTAGREPTFVLKGFTASGNLTQMLKAEMYKKAGKTVTALVPEYQMWETRGGYVPKWYPKCGWAGELCQDDMDPKTTKTLVRRTKMMQDEMAQMVWRIDFKSLQKLVEMRNDGSLTTVSTDVSEDIAEIVMRGDERVAYFRNQLVWLKSHHSSVILSNKSDHVALKNLRELNHDNVNGFVGLCLDSNLPLSVWRFAAKGSLQDVLMNHTMKLDWYFKYSLIRDLVNGMEYLHGSEIKSHGSLKSTNCAVNSRWVLMVTDFGLPMLRQGQEMEMKERLWMAPELMRMEEPPPEGNQMADVYSFSIVLSEILTRDIPYSSYNKLPQEIVNLVRAGLEPPFRPDVGNSNDADVDPSMMTLMRDCWLEDPKLRPDMRHVKAAVKQMNRGREGSLLDHALKMMERYAQNLETTIADRSKQLTDETSKANILLYKFLPCKIADKLKSGHSVEPESIDSVTVVFTDIYKFDHIAEKSSPLQLVSLLNDIYYQLDEILEEYNCFKVQTVNDTYMIACGLEQNENSSHKPGGKSHYSGPGMASSSPPTHHVAVGADLSLHILLRMAGYYMPHLPKDKCQIRIGVHTGPAVGGVVGTTTPRYLLFGDTVNTSRVMLEHSKGATIHISESTNTYLTEIIGGYITKPRGEVTLKSAGSVFTFWLLGKKTKGIDDKTATTITTSSEGSGGGKSNASLNKKK